VKRTLFCGSDIIGLWEKKNRMNKCLILNGYREIDVWMYI